MVQMKKLAVAFTFALVLALWAMQSLAADRSMRCGRYLIHAGGGPDSAWMYEVLKKCGEPAAKSGNNWIYEQGSVRRILTFNAESRLQRIESDRD